VDTLKNAEKPTIQIIVTEPEFGISQAKLYAVNRMDVGLSKPMFDSETGEMVQEYDITFVEFEDDIGEQDTGSKTLDEDGIGFGDINLSFGDFIFEGFQNLFPNLKF